MVAPLTPGDGWKGADPDQWRILSDDLAGDRPQVIRPSRINQHGPSVRTRDARVLGGTPVPADPPTVWEREPWLTVKSAPRLFAYGVPLVLLVGVIVGFWLFGLDHRTGLLAALAIDALGIAGIFGLAQRRRMDPLREHQPGGGGER